MANPNSITGLGSRITEMWGGTGNGSWCNTKLPSNASYTTDTAIETMARDDLIANQLGKVDNSANVPTYAAYPYINIDRYTTTLTVVPADQPLVPVYFDGHIKLVNGVPTRGGSKARETWAQSARAMSEVGLPIPTGMVPTVNADGTPDSDGTLVIFQPDWVWPGRPSDTRYHGRYYEMFGAVDPAKNAEFGFAERWTAKYAGRTVGALTDKRAKAYRSPGNTDTNSTADPSYTAPTPSNPLVGQESTVYVGWGANGLKTEEISNASASHLPQIQNQLITMRDLSRNDPVTGSKGYIDHTLGYMMFPAATADKGTTNATRWVWPAVAYDAASRYFCPQGTRWRLPPDWVVDQSKPWQLKMLETAMRDYGICFTETTGTTGFSFRAEAGSRSMWEFGPAVPSQNALMRMLPLGSLRMLAVGSDTNFTPTDGPVVVDPNPTPSDTTPPTVSTVTPAANATGVSTTVVPSVTFSESVQAPTTAMFSLSRSGAVVPASISGAGATWRLTPSQALVGNAQYTLTVTGGASGIKDLAGNPLATTTTHTFTTVAPPPPPPDPPPPATVGRPIRGKWRRV